MELTDKEIQLAKEYADQWHGVEPKRWTELAEKVKAAETAETPSAKVEVDEFKQQFAAELAAKVRTTNPHTPEYAKRAIERFVGGLNQSSR